MIKASKYTEPQIQGWIALFAQGKSLRAIAEATGVPWPTVGVHLRSRGFSHRVGAPRKHFDQTEAEISRRQQLKKNHGITPEEFQAMSDAQGGVCAICGKPPKGGKTSTGNLHVDHDHKTKKNRGLLCHKCNPALGQFADSIELLQRAIEYLKRHGPQA